MTDRTTPAVLTGMTLAVAGLLFVFDPAITAWFPSCPLNALTGWLCPFCGSLRAAHALLRGNIGSALHFNAMTTTAMLGGVAAFSYDAVRPGRTALVRLVSLCTSPSGLALAAMFGILRNIVE
jgi:Protein of unknown function (DUF2752)